MISEFTIRFRTDRPEEVQAIRDMHNASLYKGVLQDAFDKIRVKLKYSDISEETYNHIDEIRQYMLDRLHEHFHEDILC